MANTVYMCDNGVWYTQRSSEREMIFNPYKLWRKVHPRRRTLAKLALLDMVSEGVSVPGAGFWAPMVTRLPSTESVWVYAVRVYVLGPRRA